jgi:hypothetical protein
LPWQSAPSDRDTRYVPNPAVTQPLSGELYPSGLDVACDA